MGNLATGSHSLTWSRPGVPPLHVHRVGSSLLAFAGPLLASLLNRLSILRGGRPAFRASAGFSGTEGRRVWIITEAENVTGRQLRFLSGDNDCSPGQLDLFRARRAARRRSGKIHEGIICAWLLGLGDRRGAQGNREPDLVRQRPWPRAEYFDHKPVAKVACRGAYELRVMAKHRPLDSSEPLPYSIGAAILEPHAPMLLATGFSLLDEARLRVFKIPSTGRGSATDSALPHPAEPEPRCCSSGCRRRRRSESPSGIHRST